MKIPCGETQDAELGKFRLSVSLCQATRHAVRSVRAPGLTAGLFISGADHLHVVYRRFRGSPARVISAYLPNGPHRLGGG
jgi:hypothetical protein